MKQSGNNLERISKNDPNSKESLCNDDQKLIGGKSSMSGCSEQESDQNGDGSRNRGFWSQKANPGDFWKAGAPSSSWFTKFNQIRKNTEPHAQNKENREINLSSRKSNPNLGGLEAKGMVSNIHKMSMDAK